ncbi:outer membrane protein assembly factor BamB [Marinobacter zhejiangensis]|uniref:Outer membrane protein assembly factor BamB n=1 Tax=Marinobacter zhejiangensis TaxID=488535 RepID=A0A1I4P9P9_9GAMM|nr:outer membrane protein assembly factor BamB [Marinobacter zhejiangensis]SFM24267.1 Beta-barrel assembly machine subunit BamB [Marinobacter zhejiangensis]
MPLNLRRLFLAGMAASVLGGCSSSDSFEEPLPVPDVVSSVELEPVWNASIGEGFDEQFLQLSPLNSGETIFVVSTDGQLIAVDAEHGTFVWTKNLETQVLAGVGGDSGHLYLVSGDAKLMALDPENGEELWQVALPNETIATPRSNGQVVVAQTTDGKVLAFDTATGEKRWQYDGVVPVLTLRATAAPLVGREMTLVSFANGRLFALDSRTGQPLWQYTVGEPQGRTELERLVDVTSEPLILEGVALVTGYQGKLALVELRTGQEIWSRPTSSLRTPEVASGKIFTAEANGHIVAYDGNTRSELWTQDQLGWRQVTQPVALGDYLLVGDYEGYIHVLSLEDGSFQGQVEFDDEGLLVPMQRIGDRVLVYGNSGKLTLFELEQRD